MLSCDVILYAFWKSISESYALGKIFLSQNWKIILLSKKEIVVQIKKSPEKSFRTELKFMFYFLLK